MADQKPAEMLQDLMRDANFGALLKRSRDDYLPWNEFLRMELPAGMSAMAAWDMLVALHHGESIHFPTATPDEPHYWYITTHKMISYLSEIDRACTPNSTLYQTVTADAGRPFMVKSRVSDVAAAAQLDGLDISSHEIRRLLHLERMPKTDLERLSVNTMNLMARLDEYVTEKFTPALLNELRDQLRQGMSSSLPHTLPAMGLIRPGDVSAEEPRDNEGALRLVCAYANNEVGDPNEHPAIRALVLSDWMQGASPLPDMNNQVGRLMARLYSFKNGLPLLGMLPITHAKLAWQRGEKPYDSASIDAVGYAARRETILRDSTPYLSALLELVVITLQDLECAVQQAEEEDVSVRQALTVGVGMNHRQRSIVARAIRNPEATFRIGYHKTNHGVTYATARKDLMGLVEIGYLNVDRDGHAFVFRAGPALMARFGSEGEAI